MPYIELHTSSAFSFLDGASLPGTLIDRAAELGYPALALLDRDGVYGAPQFYRAAKAAGIKAIVGAELTIGAPASGQRPQAEGRSKDPNPGTSRGRSHQNLGPSAFGLRPDIGPAFGLRPSPWTLPVLVASAEGYRNLCRVITRAKLRAPKGSSAMTLEDFSGQTAGLIALAGRQVLHAGRHGVGGLVDRIVGVFGRSQVWMEVQRHFRRDEQSDLQSLLDLAAAFRVPIMASGGVRFATPEARPLYDVFTCLRHKTTLAEAGRRLSVNAERYLKPPETMARLFSDVPQALAGTEALAERLEFTLANLGYRFPEYPVPAGESQASFLRRLAQVGARDRYRPYHDRARAQIARELDLIERLDLAGYFLIVWDLVNFCRQQGILVQGRGSAANSAVCYALGITAVDPVGMDLLFERFLSEERGEWPDIDLDLPSGDRRERVIQYVYERYGKLGAAMTANVITYRGRSAAREVGKVLGLEADEIDRLARMMSQFEFVDPKETLARNMRESGIDPDNERYQCFAKLWCQMQDLPRHLGQHSGGMVVCQGRLDEVVPLENATMPGRVVVQWDKDDCADLGIVKVDLLGLGMMAVLEEALVIVNGPTENSELRTQNSELGSQAPARSEADEEALSSQFKVLSSKLDLAHLPPDDPVVYRMLQKADTIGVFQVESRAQMATLPRLKPEHFYDLVVEVAIIRPGPIVGNMVHPYLSRRRGDEAVTYAHPLLEPVLKRTLGVPLFQEQLLRMAMVVAGFSGGEAEELRRAMGFKRSMKRMQQIETRLRTGMAANGITGAAADQIVQSITSFALYGFPESHAASFALIVYASAYLKAHFPSAFYTALLNNQPMGFYHPATLVKDAQRHGVRFAPIDVQISDWTCRVDPDGSVRLGLMYVKGLREEAGRRIAEAKLRTSNFERRRSDTDLLRFSSIDDLVHRTALRQEEARTLAEIGALASFGGDRRTALWQAERAGRLAGPLLDGESDQEQAPAFALSSFGGQAGPWPMAQENHSPLPTMSLLDRVRADYDGTGLTIGPHPMALARTSLATRGVQRASDLPRGRPGRRVRVAGAVITRQRPGTAKGFVFLSLEDETGIANIIVNPDVFAIYKRVIVDEPYLLVEGTLQNQDGAVSVKADRVEGLKHTGPRVDSHDFH
ncbi:MAG TPA: error-prone DNA polymerase [Vicinamibacterales bacterium]|nr:error-prone DNA polymerase [Vicinamibacterales bacterium]